jgi:hypothetical protein
MRAAYNSYTNESTADQTCPVDFVQGYLRQPPTEIYCSSLCLKMCVCVCVLLQVPGLGKCPVDQSSLRHLSVWQCGM